MTARATRALRALRRPDVLALIAGIAVLAILAAVGERRRAAESVPPPSYASDDYALGGYRAFAELLRRSGFAVAGFDRRLAALGDGAPGDDPGTLVYAEPAAGDPNAIQPGLAEVAALERWVRAGGRLLYLGADDAAARRKVLGLPRGAAPGRDRPFVAAALVRAGVARVSAPRGPRYVVPPHATLLLADRAGPLALTYRFGRGRVTAEIDESLFANGAIAVADRARFAVALAGAPATGGAIAFDDAVHGELAARTWWEAFPAPLDAGLALAAFALLVAAVAAAFRLGPPVEFEPRDDLDSGEFASALASLYARAGARHAALDDALAAVRRRLALARGLAWDAPDAALVATLDPAEAEAFGTLTTLAAAPRPADADLVRGTALAHRLWKDASHGRH